MAKYDEALAQQVADKREAPSPDAAVAKPMGLVATIRRDQEPSQSRVQTSEESPLGRKYTKAQGAYTDHGPAPFICGHCCYYIQPESCQIIDDGPIKSEGSCKWWTKQDWGSDGEAETELSDQP